MTVEQRVKALEYEMKILKNEMQQMLLDIQEQLLLHYYPSLRTDEVSPSEGIRRSIEAIQKKKAALEEASGQPSFQPEQEIM
jgi:phosphomevalonate kinase